MALKKTIGNKKLIYIEDGEGSGVSVALREETARLISIQVGEARKGMGSALLKAAESETFHAGKGTLEADYISDQVALSAFLKKNGYEETQSVDILSINVSDLLASKAVRRVLKADVKGTITKKLEEVSFTQQWGMNELFDYFSMDIDAESIHYHASLSQLVYKEDDPFTPEAFLFCTVDEPRIIVDVLFGRLKKHPEYILRAFQGFLNQLLEMKPDGLDSIVFLNCREATRSLLRCLMDKSFSIDTKGVVMHAAKTLSENDERVPYEPSSDEDSDARTIRHDSVTDILQSNINWKMDWAQKYK